MESKENNEIVNAGQEILISFDVPLFLSMTNHWIALTAIGPRGLRQKRVHRLIKTTKRDDVLVWHKN
ncbi:MAG: hypothetical protein ACYCYR_15855 [Desulfobulbaceae bacterium]